MISSALATYLLASAMGSVFSISFGFDGLPQKYNKKHREPDFSKNFFPLKTNDLKTYPILFFKLIVKIFPAFCSIPLDFPGNVLYLCGGNNR